MKKSNSQIVSLIGAIIVILLLLSLWADCAKAYTDTDTLKVTVDSNDGGLRGTSFATNETSNFWGRFSDGTVLRSFFRMTSLIPAGRTIVSVTPIPQAYSISGIDTTYIKFSKTNNAGTLTSSSDWNSMAKTSDSVRWISNGTWVTGTRYRGPDCTAIWNEGYSQGYCDSGETVIFFMLGANLANVDNYRRTLDYGFSSGYAFWLEIVHVDGPSVTPGRRNRLNKFGSLEPQFIEWTKWEKVR